MPYQPVLWGSSYRSGVGGFRFFGEVRKPKPISSRSTVTVGNQVTDWRAEGGTVSSVFLETPKTNRVFSPGNRNRNQVTPTPAIDSPSTAGQGQRTPSPAHGSPESTSKNIGEDVWVKRASSARPSKPPMTNPTDNAKWHQNPGTQFTIYSRRPPQEQHSLRLVPGVPTC